MIIQTSRDIDYFSFGKEKHEMDVDSLAAGDDKYDPTKREFLESFGIAELTKRPHISIHTLLPTAEEWNRTWEDTKRHRLRLVRILAGVLLGVNLAHLLILMACFVYRIVLRNWIYKHTLPGGEAQEAYAENKLYFLTDCAAIYPKPAGYDDYYTLDFLPYATLPRKRALFAMPMHTMTFQECYQAFWLGVHPSKRQFVHGQLRFLGDELNTSCLQLGAKRANEFVSVAQCLTLSFNFRLSGASGYSGVQFGDTPTPQLPVVAYIGGSGLLRHRPGLISPQESSRIGAFYVVIRYRVGIFGFGDFGTPDYGPNHAVEDLRKALNWLHDNAAMFGGNAENITLVGEGSGATLALAISSDRCPPKEDSNET